MAGIIDVYETYQTNEIRSVRQIKNLFPEDYEHKNNWFFCSTQGAHGTHKTLDDLEENLIDKGHDKAWVTILIVQPRLCNVWYGDITVPLKDVPFLRQLVRNTLEVIPKTQRGNV